MRRIEQCHDVGISTTINLEGVQAVELGRVADFEGIGTRGSQQFEVFTSGDLDAEIVDLATTGKDFEFFELNRGRNRGLLVDVLLTNQGRSACSRSVHRPIAGNIETDQNIFNAHCGASNEILNGSVRKNGQPSVAGGHVAVGNCGQCDLRHWQSR